MKIYLIIGSFFALTLLFSGMESVNDGRRRERQEVILRFDFENTVGSSAGPSFITQDKNVSYVQGLDGKALYVSPDDSKRRIFLENSDVHLDSRHDFTVVFWVKSNMDDEQASVILLNKEFDGRGVGEQKKKGWAFYMSEGVWAWNMGSGDRRLAHEYELGVEGRYVLNDGRWHQLAMSYNKDRAEIRLFYDGDQKAIYNVKDATGFDFSTSLPLMIGSNGSDSSAIQKIRKEVEDGGAKLQHLVDEFNRLEVGKLTDEQFETLIVDPKDLFEKRSAKLGKQRNADQTKLLEPIMNIRSELLESPYTVHQVRDFMRVAPLLKIYTLNDGKIIINEQIVDEIVVKEQFFPSEFEMDNLLIWNRTLSSQEVLTSYKTYFKQKMPPLERKLSTISIGNWNIHHGGKHNSIKKDGWDSRVRIVEMLKKANVDIVMLQETYSSGAFIADQLGFYFASTIDRDYLHQGTNISVLSRYPIKEIYVPETATFMNVGVKIAISESQDMYVMSNWYGMAQFSAVYDFHQSRFSESDSIPIIFAGDFNAIPEADGGESLGAEKLLATGFIDAYRSLYPDVNRYPGYTHENGRRIDQLYYKGKTLRNNSTKVISEWPTGFPSDHYLIVSKFDM